MLDGMLAVFPSFCCLKIARIEGMWIEFHHGGLVMVYVAGAGMMYCPFPYGSNSDGDTPSVVLPIYWEVTCDRGLVAPPGYVT